MVKPFNLEEAKSGAKLVTRSGKSARIVCYDRIDDRRKSPILALVLGPNKQYEMPVSYFINGTQADFASDLDLFIKEND